ncbi:MAG: OsmC family protein [Bacteroidetes bacterium]|nr:OsmC family protein [Bacteroidota bacterium]
MAKAIIHKDHYVTTVTAGSNSVTADEPISNGGKEKGMAPMELLASSLASCTCITLRMYADRKQWPLDSVETDISIDADTAAISRVITFKGTLNAEQIHRLTDIADHCPVHKLLTKTITIKTTIHDRDY